MILSRHEDGRVYALLNRCRHRGAVVCREELVFASLSPEGPSLEEYLAPVRRYIDWWLNRSPVGRITCCRPCT
jgi:phenylpropionate dioxygenase-like ring-hydroxylating dioxygenase large terminal subunit